MRHFNIESGLCLRIFDGNKGPVYHFIIDQDTKLLYAACKDKIVKRYNSNHSLYKET